jgi:uncharacterized protein YneF (UPF0154 family)
MKRVLAVFVLGCALLAGSSAAFGADLIVISSHDLQKAFADNPRTAEEQYVGKIVQVNGIVVSKGMSRYMTPNVVLSDREGGAVRVICVLPRLDVGKLSDFTPGQNATMSGKVYRMSERGVVIKECKAVQ